MEDGGALSHWEEEKDLFLEVLLPDPSQDDIGCRYGRVGHNRRAMASEDSFRSVAACQ